MESNDARIFSQERNVTKMDERGERACMGLVSVWGLYPLYRVALPGYSYL